MDSPVLLVVEDDPAPRAALIRDLKHRYGRDYDLFSAPGAQAGLEILERLRADARPVALIIANLRMRGMAGPEFLSRARSLHPVAKRALIIDAWGGFISRELARAMTLGQADSWLTRPWIPRDQFLYPRIVGLLGEWLSDMRPRRPDAVEVVGGRWAGRSHELCDVLDRNQLPYNFYPVDTGEGRELLRRVNRGEDRLPVVIVPSGEVLVDPTNTDVAAAIGVRTRPPSDRRDVAVVGGGPAGLSAALYAASEGLRTMLIEREAFGGQAGTSSRIRNYLGFSRGVSGRHLALEAREQALAFGARSIYGEATGLRLEGTQPMVQMKDGSIAVASVVVVATGVVYRRMGVPAVEQFVGAGVFYGSSLSEAPVLRGADVCVVGGGNSAGQAVVHLSRFARRVTLVVRGKSFAESMSDYLVRELETLENVSVLLRTQIVDAGGMGRLEQLTLATEGSAARPTVPASALFVLIGSEPRTEWLGDALERDSGGFILTGAELPRRGGEGARFPLPREPFPYESSVPGVFAVGDVRANSVKRVASAVGEGAMVIQMVHRYLGGR